MRERLSALEKKITAMRHLLLEKETILALGEADKNRLLHGSSTLLARIKEISNNCLSIGLMGGTGVGKSTIMNALAGQEISSSSHRRPHTDKLLVYRHSDTVLPSVFFGHSIQIKEHLHNAAGIKNIILCDLPDFDSTNIDHRTTVLDFMEKLDMICWITSPEKYADGVFYEMVRNTPKGGESNYFVINKIDILFDGQGAAPTSDLNGIMDDFQRYLKESSGIEDPNIFTISARECTDRSRPSFWNQFPGLRREIFHQRDLKTIGEIKASNLEEEARRMLTPILDKRLALESLHKKIIRQLELAEKIRTEVLGGLSNALRGPLESSIKPALGESLSDNRMLVGPAYGISFLIDTFKKKIPDYGAIDNIASLVDGVLPLLKRHFKDYEDRIIAGLIQSGISEEITTLVKKRITATDKDFYMRNNLTAVLSESLHGNALSPHIFFRGAQYLTYSVLFIILTAVLSGKEAISLFLSSPGLKPLWNLFVSLVETLFSSRGFSALGSFIIIGIFIGYRFYRKYRKIVSKNASERTKETRNAISSILEIAMDKVTNEIGEIDKELMEAYAEISLIEAPGNKWQ